MSISQNKNNLLSAQDSLEFFIKSIDLRAYFYSGDYNHGCNVFEELLSQNYYNRGSLLYGGKCCFKSKRDSIVLKLFTEEKKEIIQDFCRLNWGANVRKDSIYISFCDVDLDEYESKLRSVLNLKLASDTLVRIFIEDQGSHLSNELKRNLIKCGYEKLLHVKLPDLNPIELNSKHINIIEGILFRYPNLSKQDVGKYGMDGIFYPLLHAKLENLEKFESSINKLFGKSSQAYYKDKIQVAKGEKQIYGTQFQFCELKGKNILYPVFEIENLNIRRMRMNLPWIENYAKHNGIEDYLEACK